MVLAVARGAALGIDVESYDKKVPLEVARRFFSPVEAMRSRRCPPMRSRVVSCGLWTLKEAYLKAVGTGIAGGLDSMTFRIDDAGACAFERAADPRAARWSFRQFDVGERHVLALARLAARESRARAKIEWREFGRRAPRRARIGPCIGPRSGQEQRAEP